MAGREGERCPKTVNNPHEEGSRRDGRCTWCGVKFTATAQRPRIVGPSDRTEAYRRTYDPDWGGGERDHDV